MNKNAKLSMILGIVGLVLSLFVAATVVGVIAIVCSVAAIVFFVMASKELKKLKNGGKGHGKGQAIAGLVCAIIAIFYMAMYFLGLMLISNVDIASAAYCPAEMNMVKDCVDNGDGTATCVYMDVLEMNCYTEVLDESQYK